MPILYGLKSHTSPKLQYFTKQPFYESYEKSKKSVQSTVAVVPIGKTLKLTGGSLTCNEALPQSIALTTKKTRDLVSYVSPFMFLIEFKFSSGIFPSK